MCRFLKIQFEQNLFSTGSHPSVYKRGVVANTWAELAALLRMVGACSS